MARGLAAQLYVELRTLLFVALAVALVATWPFRPRRRGSCLVSASPTRSAWPDHDRGSFAGVRFDPYAAMPSLHVGWSVLAATIVYRATSRIWLRAIAVAHPVLMALAVTATGNHYLADSLAGALVALLAIAVVDLGRRRRAAPRPARLQAQRRAA